MKNTLPTLLVLCLTIASPARADFASAMAAFANRDYEQARSYLEAMPVQQTEDYLFHLAVTQLRTGDPELANETLESLFAVNPDHVDGHYLQGIVNMSRVESVNLFKKAGMAKSALAAWQRVVEIDPDNIAGNYAVFSYYVNAPGFAGGDRDAAQDMLPRLDEISPTYGQLGRGLLETRDKDFAEAEAHLRKASEIGGDQAGPWFQLGRFYYEQERYDEALAALQAFEQREKTWYDPDRAMTAFYRGAVHAKLGDVTEARNSLNTAIETTGNSRIRKMAQDELKNL